MGAPYRIWFSSPKIRTYGWHHMIKVFYTKPNILVLIFDRKDKSMVAGYLTKDLSSERQFFFSNGIFLDFQ